MYHYVKKLMYNVCVETPDPRFGRMLLEQFGGENGELPPTTGLVDQFLHDSTSGDAATRSEVPDYIKGGFKVIDDPAFLEVDGPGTAAAHPAKHAHARSRH